ncbi:MAG: PP2C family protein-serine/threonine phosphatase [Planctomycetota bacterium]
MSASPAPPLSSLGRALRHSAVIRTWTVIILSAFLGVALTLRYLIDPAAPTLVPISLGLSVIVFESLMLWLFRRHDPERGVPAGLVVIQTVFECTIPAAASVLNWLTGAAEAWVMVVGPSLITYTMFIVLAILHLRPWLTTLAGLVCALVQGVFVAGVLTVGAVPQGVIPTGLLITYPVWLTIVGIVGGFVTARVRGYVEIAVHEAQELAVAEGEIDAASVVQRRMLPADTPALSGWTVAGWSRPAVQNGGDFWDWIARPDGRVAVSIADVAGHGLGPAVVGSACRAYARGALHDSPDLREAVRRTAGLIAGDMPPGRFVTYAVALLTPDAGRVSLLSAGHGPTLLVHAADGQVDLFEADDLPLGVTPEFTIDTVPELDLAAGDSLLLLTDGFFEWQGATSEQWGIDRLVAAAAEHRHLPPDAMIAALLADVEAFAEGTEQSDDLTAVVIRRGDT